MVLWTVCTLSAKAVRGDAQTSSRVVTISSAGSRSSRSPTGAQLPARQPGNRTGRSAHPHAAACRASSTHTPFPLPGVGTLSSAPPSGVVARKRAGHHWCDFRSSVRRDRLRMRTGSRCGGWVGGVAPPVAAARNGYDPPPPHCRRSGTCEGRDSGEELPGRRRLHAGAVAPASQRVQPRLQRRLKFSGTQFSGSFWPPAGPE